MMSSEIVGPLLEQLNTARLANALRDYMVGTHHKFRRKCLPLYVAEFQQ